MKIIVGVMLAVIYGLLGYVLEQNSVIVEPSAWALYGAIFGGIIMLVMTHED